MTGFTVIDSANYPNTMKPKSKRSGKSRKAPKKKSAYSQTANAIEKKVEEIKRESKKKAVVNNNLSLFRYII